MSKSYSFFNVKVTILISKSNYLNLKFFIDFIFLISQNAQKVLTREHFLSLHDNDLANNYNHIDQFLFFLSIKQKDNSLIWFYYLNGIHLVDAQSFNNVHLLRVEYFSHLMKDLDINIYYAIVVVHDRLVSMMATPFKRWN